MQNIWARPLQSVRMYGPPVDFMDEIIRLCPSAARVIAERRREEGSQINVYMEMGDLIYWLGETHKRARSSGSDAAAAASEVRTFLQLLERDFETGNQELDDLIAVGLLEGLRLTGDEFEYVRQELPPKMSAWFEAAERG